MLDNTKVPMSNANSCTAGDSQAKTTEMSSQMIKVSLLSLEMTFNQLL